MDHAETTHAPGWPMLFAAVTWAALAAAYLLFAGQASGHELAAGAGASVLAAVYAIVAHRAADAPLRLRLPWLRVIAHVATALVSDTVGVVPALLRGTSGRLALQAFAPDDRSQPGRRAVAILAESIAPNSFVVDTDSDGMLMHRLAGRRGGADRDSSA